MGYVQPNSDIELMYVQGLDDRYLHSLYFNSVQERDSFFASKVRISFSRQSYTRPFAGALRIRTGYDSVGSYNYMRFRNPPSNDVAPQARSYKWYYCFINECRYINEQVTEVSYEIDEIQTWFIGSNLLPCLVEREHTNNDTIGLNLEAEPFGSEVYDSDLIKADENTNSDLSLVITATNVSFNKLTIYPLSYYTDGVYNPTFVFLKPIPLGTEDTIRKELGEFTDNVFDYIKGSYDEETGKTIRPKGEILSVRIMFTNYTNPVSLEASPVLSESGNQKHYRIDVAKPTKYDNYTPQNNKMLTYPFSFMYATTGAGDVGEFHWELFDGDTASFDSYGNITGEPTINYVPLDYNGQIENLDNRFCISDFPICPFSYDAFQAWIASGGLAKARNERNIAMLQHGVSIATSLVGIGASVATAGLSNYATGMINFATMAASDINAYGRVMYGTDSYKSLVERQHASAQRNALESGALSGANGILQNAIGMYKAQKNYEYKFADARYQPRVVTGSSGGSSLYGAHLVETRFYHAHIRDDEAKRVDEQFTLYGYATNRVKKPNLTGRKYWNFIKTNGATVVGNMPASSATAIGQILDSGITFWHGDYAGNYNIGNNGDVITNPIL